MGVHVEHHSVVSAASGALRGGASLQTVLDGLSVVTPEPAALNELAAAPDGWKKMAMEFLVTHRERLEHNRFPVLDVLHVLATHRGDAPPSAEFLRRRADAAVETDEAAVFLDGLRLDRRLI